MSSTNSGKIGVFTATIVCMNAMIGAGIFTIPSNLSNFAGPAGLVAFALVTFSVWCLAQSFSRVAQIYPQEGAFYTYASQWGGHYTGVLASGLYISGLAIGMGLLAKMIGSSLHQYIPSISAFLLGLIALILITGLNLMDVAMSKIGGQILIALTLFTLISVTIVCFCKGSWSNFHPFMPHGAASIFGATKFVAFAFFGFESASSLYSIIENPEENVPKALTYSIVLVSIIYLAFVSSMFYAIPSEVFAANPGPITSQLHHIFPADSFFFKLINVACLTALIGVLHAVIWGLSTLTNSFARKLKCTAIRNLVNSNCINKTTSTLFVGFLIFLSFYFLEGDLFFSYTALFIITSMVLSVIALLFVKQEWTSKRNVIALAGLFTAFIILWFSLESILNNGKNNNETIQEVATSIFD